MSCLYASIWWRTVDLHNLPGTTQMEHIRKLSERIVDRHPVNPPLWMGCVMLASTLATLWLGYRLLILAGAPPVSF